MTLTEAARAALPVTSGLAYLNTASMGPVSTVYADALAAATAADLAAGRAVAARYRALDAARERLRSELAALLACEPADLKLTQSTSAGLEAAIGAFDWEPGDEIVTTDAEHAACARPLARLAGQRGVVLRTAALPPRPDGDLEWLEARIGPRTRLIAISAVTYEIGARLPIDAIAALARARGIATLVDGAQCAGAAPLFPARWNVDFCALPLQKWLLGPEGLGALYVCAERAATLAAPPIDRVTHGVGIVDAAAAHLGWLRDRFGWTSIFERTSALADYARCALAAIDGATVLTPAAHAGIVTVRCPAGRRVDVDRLLAERGILVRHLPGLGALRVSTAFFDTEAEVDRLTAATASLGDGR